MSTIPGNYFGTVDFSPAAIEGDEAASAVTSGESTEPSGDVQLKGPVVIPEPTLTAGDQALMEMVQFRGVPLPLAEQMRAGLDPEKMNALVEECNSGKLSVNDLAAELMILMINNAFENKSIERQMRAELAQVQFQNGMKIADMIKAKGDLAYKKAVTQAVTKMTACVADIAATKIADHIASRKEGADHLNLAQKGGTDDTRGFKYDPEKRNAIRQAGKLTSEALRTTVETAGNLMCAELDLKTSQIDAQQKAAEAMNKLLDSVASSVESSIRAQDQAIQFAMGMLDKINNLAHDSLSRIIGNMR
ncbi:MAG: hypothetical protein LBB05_00910 [Puniceicoccales bacterium]|jgi:hypothetical protein|nr:hypothetical protein [Puniceicoccales bacterium]